MNASRKQLPFGNWSVESCLHVSRISFNISSWTKTSRGNSAQFLINLSIMSCINLHTEPGNYGPLLMTDCIPATWSFVSKQMAATLNNESHGINTSDVNTPSSPSRETWVEKGWGTCLYITQILPASPHPSPFFLFTEASHTIKNPIQMPILNFSAVLGAICCS